MQSNLMNVRLALCLFALLIFSGCQSAPTARSTASRDSGAMADFGQTLAPGDALRLQFIGATELNQTQKVRPDGRITLPMIGELSVAGKRPAEVQAQLGELYQAKLQNSEVYVTVENSSVPIYVSGAVNRPGRVVLDRQLTALEAIMEAGGFARGLADAKHVRIIRKVGEKHQTIEVDLTKAMRGETTDVVYVQRNDVIHVPETWL